MGRPAINEIGKRYGMLTVIERYGNTWPIKYRCVCDCGKERIVKGQSLRGEEIMLSCGCTRKKRYLGDRSINEIGNVYGLLTVVERTENRIRKNEFGKIVRIESAWLCQCSCGKKVEILGRSLRDGNTRSCGCRGCAPDDGAFNKLYARMVCSARDRHYEWNLTKEDVRRITSQNCFYCGVSPCQFTGNGKSNYIYNGIDRMDNTKGYILENSVACCWRCNSAKNSFSVSEFKDWVLSVYNHLFTQ